MGGMPMGPGSLAWAKLLAEQSVDIELSSLKFEEGVDLGGFVPASLPRHDGFVHPMNRRSRGPQAHRARRSNRNHVSTRRKHRRAA